MLEERIRALLGEYIHLSDPSKYDVLEQYVLQRPWLVIRLLRNDVAAEIVLEADRLNRITQGMYSED